MTTGGSVIHRVGGGEGHVQVLAGSCMLPRSFVSSQFTYRDRDSQRDQTESAAETEAHIHTHSIHSHGQIRTTYNNNNN